MNWVGKDEEEHNSSGRATCKGRENVEDEHEKVRIAKRDAHLDEVCVRVEHHRTITIREATYAHRFKRVPQKADMAVAGWT